MTDALLGPSGPNNLSDKLVKCDGRAEADRNLPRSPLGTTPQMMKDLSELSGGISALSVTLSSPACLWMGRLSHQKKKKAKQEHAEKPTTPQTTKSLI